MQNLAEIITAIGGGGAVSSALTYLTVRKKVGTDLEAEFMKRFDEAIKRREERIDKLEEKLDTKEQQLMDAVQEEREQCKQELLELELRLEEKWERLITSQYKAINEG
jgi:Skp family chaperone for outer membrane proteins